MQNIYRVNPELEIPIYQQLVDAVRTAVKKEELQPGTKLPTVSEMTDLLGIARGTVKRAYDELERAGLIEKVQGRGTFVRYRPENSGSRKELAMAAIEDVFVKLEDMGFSTAEINIFLNLKLRELSEKEACVKVAVIECNPENLSQMSEQLRHIPGVDLYSYMMDDIKQYPYKLSEDFDLIVTTSAHSEYIENTVPSKKRLARVALRPSAICISNIIKLKPGVKTGIVGYSERFGELLYNTCGFYAEEINLSEPVTVADEKAVVDYIKGKDVLLVPKLYERLFSSSLAEMIRNFNGVVIECFYEMDEGSSLYLESKIKKILDDKQI